MVSASCTPAHGGHTPPPGLRGSRGRGLRSKGLTLADGAPLGGLAAAANVPGRPSTTLTAAEALPAGGPGGWVMPSQEPAPQPARTPRSPWSSGCPWGRAAAVPLRPEPKPGTKVPGPQHPRLPRGGRLQPSPGRFRAASSFSTKTAPSRRMPPAAAPGLWGTVLGDGPPHLLPTSGFSHQSQVETRSAWGRRYWGRARSPPRPSSPRCACCDASDTNRTTEPPPRRQHRDHELPKHKSCCTRNTLTVVCVFQKD